MSRLLRDSLPMDRGLAAAVLVGTLVEAGLDPHGWRWLLLPVAGVVLAIGVLGRRLRPDLGFGALVAAVLVEVPARVLGTDATSLATAIAALVLLHALGRHGTPPRNVYQLAAVTALNLGLVAWDRRPLTEAVGVVLLVVAVAGVGVLLRWREHRAAARVEQLKRDERAHLARDLHDVIAHYMSAVAMRADAGALVAESNPEGARRALEEIHATARESLNDIRKLIGILRDPAAEDSESARLAPDLRNLPHLATTVPPVVSITTPATLDRVPLAASRALYRVAQESITNARRHGVEVSSIEVRVDHTEKGVRLMVHDDGRLAGTNREGHGLTGMRERMELLDGTLSAGPDPYGGWTVEANVPGRGFSW